MRPSSWHPPVEPSSFEQTIITRIKRAKLFVFLRHHRHELFDDAFQVVPGGVVQFPKETCAECPLKAQCTTSAKGRSVSIYPDEALLVELRQAQQTPEGRHKLRERVAVEHIGRWQGRRARYRGLPKNLFDLRRCAVVHNLHVLARSQSLHKLSFKTSLDFLTGALATHIFSILLTYQDSLATTAQAFSSHP